MKPDLHIDGDGESLPPFGTCHGAGMLACVVLLQVLLGRKDNELFLQAAGVAAQVVLVPEMLCTMTFDS